MLKVSVARARRHREMEVGEVGQRLCPSMGWPEHSIRNEVLANLSFTFYQALLLAAGGGVCAIVLRISCLDLFEVAREGVPAVVPRQSLAGPLSLPSADKRLNTQGEYPVSFERVRKGLARFDGKALKGPSSASAPAGEAWSKRDMLVFDEVIEGAEAIETTEARLFETAFFGAVVDLCPIVDPY